MNFVESVSQNRDRIIRVLVPVLLVLWATAAVLVWWTAPRAATPQQVAAVMERGDARTVTRSVPRPGSVAGHVLAPMQVSEPPTKGEYLVWQDARLQRHWTDLSSLEIREQVLGQDGTVDAAALAFSDRARPGGSHLVVHPEIIVDLLTGVLSLALVFVGPAQRGTRWFWGWLLLAGLPLNVGLLAYCWIELLDRGTLGRERRVTGVWGFLMVVVGSLAAVSLR